LADSDISAASIGSRSYSTIDKYWTTNPSVYICKHLRIPRSRISKAISYWERLGYSFEKVTFDHNGPECNGMPSFGSIIITIPGQNFNQSKMAVTRCTFDSKSREILYSEIQIPSFNVTKERVLEHELGHALGWGHSNRKYYIMNENWKLGGYDSSGLSKDRYIELYEDVLLKLE
tara:strand:- start:883 stop:1407 length:525 start_codon:yes stop_codon:yes gene_type:complete